MTDISQSCSLIPVVNVRYDSDCTHTEHVASNICLSMCVCVCGVCKQTYTLMVELEIWTLCAAFRITYLDVLFEYRYRINIEQGPTHISLYFFTWDIYLIIRRPPYSFDSTLKQVSFAFYFLSLKDLDACTRPSALWRKKKLTLLFEQVDFFFTLYFLYFTFLPFHSLFILSRVIYFLWLYVWPFLLYCLYSLPKPLSI